MNITVRLHSVALVAALVCASASFSQQAAPQAAAGRGAQAQVPRVVSPEILPDKRVTFRLRAPEAKQVRLAGVAILTALGRTNQPVPFKKGDNGI